nr:hypothetical protein [Tanacetum cinerariifolium]
MATTINQQVVLDESLVPSTQRAFQVTADVPEIYMQEFWLRLSVIITLSVSRSTPKREFLIWKLLERCCI